VGVTPNVVTISVEEFELLKFELEEAHRNISQKQNELIHERQRAIQHQQQLQEQLTTSIDREEQAVERQRQIQPTLDQAKVDLHTAQDEKTELEQQKLHKINLIHDATELVRVHSEQQQQQQIQQIRQAADQQTTLANTARNEAAQRIIDAQALRDQATQHELAAQVVKDQAVLAQQVAD